MTITLNGTTGITTPDLTSTDDITANSSTVLTSASSIPAANLTGSLPALDGSALTGIAGAVAFARINQSTVLSSYNISSVSISGSNATVTFATPLQDANYAPLVSPSLNSTAQFGNSGNSASTHSITTSSFQIYGRGYTGSNNTTYNYTGVFNAMGIAVFR